MRIDLLSRRYSSEKCQSTDRNKSIGKFFTLVDLRSVFWDWIIFLYTGFFFWIFVSYELFPGKESCNNVTVWLSDFFLGEGYDSVGSLQWRRSGSDLLQLCFGHFPTSYMKINCTKNIQKFSKTVWCNEIKKTNFMYVIIHHHFLQWFSHSYLPPYCQIEASKYLNSIH